MKLVNALLGTALSFCALSAQNQTLDSIAVSTKYLDEVVVTDSRFALKRSQSGKTVVKIKQEEIQQFSGLGFGPPFGYHVGGVLEAQMETGAIKKPLPKNNTEK